MTHERAAVRAPTVERRPAPAETIQRSAAARTPAQVLQQRYGNGATSAIVQRAAGAQRLAQVSAPGDAAEVEAHDTARKVMRMAAPPSSAAPPPASAPATSGGGAPLPAAVRGFMEARFHADFSGVRVHTDEAAAQRSEALQAHAYTVGQHIHFGRDKFQPDSADGRELIAHELTHTVQQGAAIQRSADVAVEQRSVPRVQRWGFDSALNYIADKANYIPGFRLLTIVLGTNPVNLAPVERSAANILRALLELIPVTGALLAQALDAYGIFAKVGAWVETQIHTLGMVGSALKRALDDFLHSLSWSDVLDPGGVWDRAKRIFTEPIDRLLAFGRSLAGDILRFIREAILLPLARLAQGTRGYDLLCAVLGEDPVTGEAVPRTPDTLIGGFMKLIGREDVWENIKKANALPRAWAWFQGALAALVGFVRQIPTLFVNALKALEPADLILVPRAFGKLVGVFGGFVVQFLTWAGNAVYSLLEIILEALAPGAIPYLKKAAGAFRTILDSPIRFVGNLVAAGKLGLEQFVEHFGAHLKASLIEWLTGSLPGVYIPQAFELKEILKFVLSMLGLTWQNIRQKLVKAVGEPAVKAMETGFDIVVTLVTEGPAAAWDKIKDQLANLKDMVIGGIVQFVAETIIKKAVVKLVGMLVPGGAFISAILSIYDTIMVFVNKLAKIVQVAMAFLDSIIEIAAGKIAGAAAKVEKTLGGLLTLAISFLAGFLGLGKIADQVMDFLNTKVRAPIDKALDFLVGWIVNAAKALFSKVTGKKDDRTDEQKQTDLDKAMNEAEVLRAKPDVTEAEIRQGLPAIKAKYKMQSLDLVVDSEDETSETVHLEGSINPGKKGAKSKVPKEPEGSEKNPVDFQWVKPAVSGYPSIDLIISGKNVKVAPQSGATVGGLTIGVSYKDALKIADGKKLLVQPPVTGNSVKDNMNKVLAANGYDRDKGDQKPRDTDHIVEKQLGGPDDLSNLWPLNASTNRSSGSTVRAEIARITTAHKWKSLAGKWIKLKF